MIKNLNSFILYFVLMVGNGCSISGERPLLQHVNGTQKAGSNEIRLTHEHILVDFVGADSIRPNSWNHETVIKEVLPFIDELKEFKVNYFVDAGWYDPQKETQNIKPYMNIFRKLYPELKSKGFSEDEFKLLVPVNPSKAYAIKLRTVR